VCKKSFGGFFMIQPGDKLRFLYVSNYTPPAESFY
jgi:hypothetical protein